nr:hypothetical protein [Tanacetum cinerariifolium]
MTKVIKGEFKKIKDVKVEDVSLTCNTSHEVFNNEVSQLRRMDDDLFTYEVEVANIPCDSKIDDDSEHEADDDMGYDSGDDEVELTDEESSDDMDEVPEFFRIDTNLFKFETPMCKAFNEFNCLLQIDPNLLTKDIEGFKTYEGMIGSMNGIRMYRGSMRNHRLTLEFGPNLHQLNILASLSTIRLGVQNGQHVVGRMMDTYEALEDSELKDGALRNKAIMEEFIKEDDESGYEQKRQWNIYTNYDDAYEINHEDNESEELYEVHELPVCNIRRYMMIKYSFNNDEEYVAVKEDKYNDLTIIRKEACRAYQEIFRILDEGWMVTRAE